VNIEVIRSERRRKTVQARLVDGVLRIAIPATATEAEEQRWVELMKAKFERQATAQPIDLAERSRRLAREYELPVPDSIRWVDNQRTRWGSCTPETRSIRISTQVAPFPGWVVDSVIIHELAHLVEPGHGPGFQALIDRYPHAERAKGFLIAVGGGWNDATQAGVAG
jgi:predicted metal-dependent hydrolase